MYVIVVYDINISRVSKINAYLKRYLFWVQNSVFEGELSVKDTKNMIKGLKKRINKHEDSVIIYILPSESVIMKKHIGKDKGNIEPFI